jgi:hypothetical protein
MVAVAAAAAAAVQHPKLRISPIHIIFVTFLASAIVVSNAAITTTGIRTPSATATAKAAFVASCSSIGSKQKQKDIEEIQPHYLNYRHSTIISRDSQHTIPAAAPYGALSDIVVPSIYNLSDWTNNNKNSNNNGNNAEHDGYDEEEQDPRIWVPQTPTLSFRPLCLCTSQGYYVNLLKFTGGGTLGRHRHRTRRPNWPGICRILE